MSKSKSKGAKDTTNSSSAILNKVKDAAITKPAQTVAAKSKDLAKAVVGKDEKKKQKKVKEPTPEPSDSESEDSASSASDSGDDSEVETKKPVKNGKTNGTTKKAKTTDDSEDDSASSDSSDDEAPTNGVSVKAPAVAAKVDSSDDDSDEESDDEPTAAMGAESSDDSDSDEASDEEEKPNKNKGPVKATELSKKLSVASEQESDDDSEEDSDDSDESEAEVETKPKQSVKRKAEDDAVPAAKKSKTEVEGDTSRGSNLFVGNLSWNVNEEWLTSEFEEFGELSGVRLITDRDTGRSKGFGYIEFVNAADAAKAFEGKKGAELDGRTINVDFASGRSAGGNQQDRSQARAKSYGDSTNDPSDTLFCGNLAFDAGQDTISEAFGEHGTILGVRLPTDRETGQPKGFGYVTFASVDEAKVALEAMQGADIAGRAVRLDYSQPRPQNGDSPARGRGGFGGGGRGRGFGDRGGRGRGGFGDRGGRGGGRGRGGFGDRGGRGGRGASTNRGGFGDFSGKKTTF